MLGVGRWGEEKPHSLLVTFQTCPVILEISVECSQKAKNKFTT